VDVVIIGAGPAGLALGCYLSKAGISNLIVEKATHPRPHVGESLMPSTVRVLRDIDFLPTMEAADFVRSDGVVYHPLDGAQPIEIAYSEFPQEGVLQDHTYHVDRSKFDLLLLKHAEALGSQILQGLPVTEVVFDEQARATGVKVEVAGHAMEISARIVVDASGRATHLGRQADLREEDRELKQFSVHAWFVDVDRGEEKTAGYTQVFFLPVRRGWAWQAPLSAEITSIGVVADRDSFKESGLGAEDFFDACLLSNPALSRAVRVAGRINFLKGDANYTYRLTHICGDGWMAIGDAARFVDPIFSSGVGVAMHSAKFAAEQITLALEKGDTTRACLAPYEEKMFAGAEIAADFTRVFYDSLPAFTHFVQSNDHRLEVLRLLQGEIFNRNEAPVLAEMKRFARE
jgi:1H-pyrrole-2-carbonyl-[peptidyl-carrier protein] chlorinase